MENGRRIVGTVSQFVLDSTSFRLCHRKIVPHCYTDEHPSATGVGVPRWWTWFYPKGIDVDSPRRMPIEVRSLNEEFGDENPWGQRTNEQHHSTIHDRLTCRAADVAIGTWWSLPLAQVSRCLPYEFAVKTYHGHSFIFAPHRLHCERLRLVRIYR